MISIQAMRRGVRGTRDVTRIRVPLRSPREVLWTLGEILNRGWVLAPAGFRAKPGAQVEVAFELPPPAPLVRTPGVVIGAGRSAAGETGPAVIRFANLTATDKGEIDKLLHLYRQTDRARQWEAARVTRASAP